MKRVLSDGKACENSKTIFCKIYVVNLSETMT